MTRGAMKSSAFATSASSTRISQCQIRRVRPFDRHPHIRLLRGGQHGVGLEDAARDHRWVGGLCLVAFGRVRDRRTTGHAVDAGAVDDVVQHFLVALQRGIRLRRGLRIGLRKCWN